MSFFSLISTILVGVLFFIIYFGLSNFILDFICRFKKNSVALENSVRTIIFIFPAFLVLFVFILYPVFETVRLSFYDKFGREFIGLDIPIDYGDSQHKYLKLQDANKEFYIHTGTAAVNKPSFMHYVSGGYAVDAPVTGSLDSAIRGDMIMFVGGSEIAVEKAKEVLDRIG